MIQKESWKEARVEVPLIGLRFKYIDSVKTLRAYELIRETFESSSEAY